MGKLNGNRTTTEELWHDIIILAWISEGEKNDSQYSSEIQAVIFLSKESIIPRK